MGVIVFNDWQLQQQLDKDCYLVVPFLSVEEGSGLPKLYEEVTKDNPSFFHSTSLTCFKRCKSKHKAVFFQCWVVYKFDNCIGIAWKSS
jgi:hypothetical protein